MLRHLPIFGLIIGFVLSIGVGPVTILVFHRTVNKGWLLGLVSGLGVALSDTIYAALSRTGTIFLQDFVRDHQFWFQLGLGFLLMIIGVLLFFSHNTREKHFYVQKSYWKNFVSAFLLALANVLYIFTYGLVFAKFIPEKYSLAGEFLLILGVGVGAVLWQVVTTSVFARFHINIQKMYILNKILGAAIFFFGIASFIELFVF